MSPVKPSDHTDEEANTQVISLKPSPVTMTTSSIRNVGSPLLDKLPPEIRNIIYQMTFTPICGRVENINGSNQGDDSIPVELLQARPPSKNLRLVCNQLNVETRFIYRAAYRKYWLTTDFVAYLGAYTKVQYLEGLQRKFKQNDINQITKLTIPRSHALPGRPQINISLLDARGGWERRSISIDSYQGHVDYLCFDADNGSYAFFESEEALLEYCAELRYPRSLFDQIARWIWKFRD